MTSVKLNKQYHVNSLKQGRCGHVDDLTQRSETGDCSMPCRWEKNETRWIESKWFRRKYEPHLFVPVPRGSEGRFTVWVKYSIAWITPQLDKFKVLYVANEGDWKSFSESSSDTWRWEQQNVQQSTGPSNHNDAWFEDANLKLHSNDNRYMTLSKDSVSARMRPVVSNMPNTRQSSGFPLSQDAQAIKSSLSEGVFCLGTVLTT
jgi:hypothetical protein